MKMKHICVVMETMGIRKNFQLGFQFGSAMVDKKVICDCLPLSKRGGGGGGKRIQVIIVKVILVASIDGGSRIGRNPRGSWQSKCVTFRRRS